MLMQGQANVTVYQGSGLAYPLGTPVVLYQGYRRRRSATASTSVRHCESRSDEATQDRCEPQRNVSTSSRDHPESGGWVASTLRVSQ